MKIREFIKQHGLKKGKKRTSKDFYYENDTYVFSCCWWSDKRIVGAYASVWVWLYRIGTTETECGHFHVIAPYNILDVEIPEYMCDRLHAFILSMELLS